MTIGQRIAHLRERRGLSQAALAKDLNIGQSTLAMWETDKRGLKDEVIIQIAEYFDVSTDYLLGRTSKKEYYELNDKDERDIANDLEKMINDLSANGLLFSKDSSEVDKETRELLIASLENSLRIAKIEAKKKFTPKKYRD